MKTDDSRPSLSWRNILGGVVTACLLLPLPAYAVVWTSVTGTHNAPTGDPLFSSVTFSNPTSNDFLVSFTIPAGQTNVQGIETVVVNFGGANVQPSDPINATWANLHVLQNSNSPPPTLGDIQVSITANTGTVNNMFNLDIPPNTTPPDSPTVTGTSNLTGAQQITITFNYDSTLTQIGNPTSITPQTFTLDFHN